MICPVTTAVHYQLPNIVLAREYVQYVFKKHVYTYAIHGIVNLQTVVALGNTL